MKQLAEVLADPVRRDSLPMSSDVGELAALQSTI
jgi:hypothetical protein